jgi:hypothetical protein
MAFIPNLTPLLPWHQDYFPGLKQPNREADNSPQFNVEFKHMWSSTSILPYVLWRRGFKHRITPSFALHIPRNLCRFIRSITLIYFTISHELITAFAYLIILTSRNLKKYIFYTQKFYYQLVARFFHIYCTQPLHISVMYVGHLMLVTSLVDMCIAYGNLLQITGRLYTYTVYNVIRI